MTELSTSPGSVQGSKDALVRDLKRVVCDADDLMKQVNHSTTEEFTAARSMMEAKLNEARARINEARIEAAKKASMAAGAAKEYIRENPWKVIGGGVVAGLIAAFVISRR